jgi:peptidoglycan-associated lipoprotein
MTKKSFHIFIFVLCLGLFLAGCPKKQVVVNRDQSSAQLEREREAKEAKERELARLREEDLKKPARGELEKTLVAKKEPGIEGEVFETKLLKDIHFDFDKYEIRREDEAILKENAGFLKNNPKMKIQIEGHCDERGTVEYNLALGERRASNTKKYLILLGIPSDRISTISYGKERPLDKGHDEQAWAKNRRAHVVVLSR